MKKLTKKKYPIVIYEALKKKYGYVRSPLKYKDTYQFCIAVILSAQCTDKQVNEVTPELFKAFPSIESLASAPLEEIEKYIYKTGFYKNKAKNIKNFCKEIIEKYNKNIPDNMNDLLKLPGIGRKTANVILQELYNYPSGIVVDTHVKRLSKVLGFTNQNNPLKIEKELCKIFPEDYWISLSLYLIFLGREFCTARKKHCNICVLKEICISSSYRKYT